jgi:hypothetical protein
MGKLPLDWWDGQPTNLRIMIEEIHRVLGQKHFKFQDLVDQLTDLGYSIDLKTGDVTKSFWKSPEGNSSN